MQLPGPALPLRVLLPGLAAAEGHQPTAGADDRSGDGAGGAVQVGEGHPSTQPPALLFPLWELPGRAQPAARSPGALLANTIDHLPWCRAAHQRLANHAEEVAFNDPPAGMAEQMIL